MNNVSFVTLINYLSHRLLNYEVGTPHLSKYCSFLRSNLTNGSRPTS